LADERRPGRDRLEFGDFCAALFIFFVIDFWGQLMFEPKYYCEIEKAQLETAKQPQDALPPFNIDDLGADSWRRRIRLWLTDLLLPPILFLLREFWPIAKVGRFVIVTRESDVRDVLTRTDAFEVPFGREMTELAGGRNFVLGLEGELHTEQDNVIAAAIGDQRSKLAGTSEPIVDSGLADNEILRIVSARSDVALVAQLSNRFAAALIRNSGGRIDVMKDFITRVATETCVRYFGLTIDDPDAFAEWSMSISALLFADPLGDPATRGLALNGSARIRNVIDKSIAEQRATPTDTVLGRLIRLQNQGVPVSNAKIRAILVGMIAGFIPTNTLAAGRIFQELQRRPIAMRAAIEKARGAMRIEQAGQGTGETVNADKEALQTILYEAVRLSPPLTPGQWRYAKQQSYVGTDPSRRKSVPERSVLMVATMSALRDRRAIKAPGKFRIDRKSDSADLAFGMGTHGCLGKYLAMAQFTELFMVLLSQSNLRYSEDTWGSRIRWVGPFPCRLDMEFDLAVAPASQTMLTICAPLHANEGEDLGAKADDVRRRIAALGNPAEALMRTMLDETRIVHFASLSVIEAGNVKDPAPHLLLELNVDGSKEAAIRTIADADAANGGRLQSIFQNTAMGKAGLAEILSSFILDLRTRPWGAIGLNFNGTPEFSVPGIAMQKSLAEFSSDALQFFLNFHLGIGNRAMQALDFVRSFIVHPQRWAGVTPGGRTQVTLDDLLRRGEKFAQDDVLMIPSRRQLRISNWKQCSRWGAVFNFLRTWDYWSLALPVIATAILFAVAIFLASAGGEPLWVRLPGRITLALVGGPATALALLGLIAAGFLTLLRYHETHDIPDDQNPKLQDVRTIAGVENPPGFVQNHFMAVTELKGGWFRKLTLAMALWGIKQMVLNYFRPGFVLNMGTIHYAKWFRLPGRDTLIFQANYDGSWDSYLEDFVMKAHAGQTAAWSNGVGFPRTRFLILDGAQDGDRFKRWVRRQQVLSQFWYSRFKSLTTDEIRDNALIHDGLARASTDLAARAWLDCFGSMPRPDYAIETDEIQSLVFRGQRYLRYAICVAIRLPNDRAACFKWLANLVSGAESPHGGAYQPNRGSCAITFGDHPFTADPELQNLATFVGFSAAGLAKLGLSDPTKHDGLGTFPNTFNLGMANRGRILGDFGESASSKWRWADTAQLDGGAGNAAPGADAVLFIYAENAARCEQALDEHLATLGEDALIDAIPTQPPTERIVYDDNGRAILTPQPADDSADEEKAAQIEYEHFGFRDGISQPAIRGTQRFLKGVSKRDVVEPGEFILGYRNNQGYYPPTATIRAESDWKNHLPAVLVDQPSRFPSFEEGNSAARDFGRNGSFIVVRQLAQNVKGFAAFAEREAGRIKEDFPNLADITGAPINAKWLAAKMLGRWPDGTPLVEQPGADRGDSPRKREMTENNFSYGVDDPQGLRCPFGAHMRRANPRDSMQPGDPDEQLITNRHRLLRRGRSYEYHPAREATAEAGLLFTCLCADLDRQFEFVQQSWIQSPSFHGLTNEPDPMLAWSDLGKRQTFTIPTPSGPIRVRDIESFVTVRAGGYFFLPSRSAIQYLVDINRTHASDVVAEAARQV
jgi:Dyp-type peroxidase family